MTSISSLLEPIVQPLGWMLIHSLWQGMCVAAVLAVVLRAMRAANAPARYLASAIAMLILPAGMIATFVIQYEPAQTDLIVRPMPAGPSIVSIQTMPAPGIDADPPLMPLPPGPAPVISAEALQYIVIAWAIGVILMSLWYVGGWILLSRARHGGAPSSLLPLCDRLQKQMRIKRSVRLVETARVAVPGVVGALKPVILLPVGILNDLGASQVQAILAHELAHIRRHDYLANILQTVIETVLFYHPAAWWISSKVRQERENCCDDIAAEVCGDRHAYAEALAALETQLMPRLAVAATGGDLLNRVRRLLRLPPVRRRASRARSLATALLALACVALPWVVLAQQKAATEPESSSIRPEDLEAKIEDYRIGPGDIVAISITDLVSPGVETVKTSRVTDSGTVGLPLIGALKFGGLTVVEAEQEVIDAYREAQIIQKAHVAVTVGEARQRIFKILGVVEQAGEYEIKEGNFRLLDALAIGKARMAGVSNLHVIRKTDGKPRRIDIPVDRLMRGDPDVNIVIRPGDTVLLPGNPPSSEPPATQPAATQPTDAELQLNQLLKDREMLVVALAEARTKLGEAHPQIVQLKRRLELFEKKIAEMEKQQPATGPAAQSDAFMPSMDELLRRRESLASELRKAVADRSPHVAQLESRFASNEKQIAMRVEQRSTMLTRRDAISRLIEGIGRKVGDLRNLPQSEEVRRELDTYQRQMVNYEAEVVQLNTRLREVHEGASVARGISLIPSAEAQRDGATGFTVGLVHDRSNPFNWSFAENGALADFTQFSSRQEKWNDGLRFVFGAHSADDGNTTAEWKGEIRAGLVFGEVTFTSGGEKVEPDAIDRKLNDLWANTYEPRIIYVNSKAFNEKEVQNEYHLAAGTLRRRLEMQGRTLKYRFSGMEVISE